MITEEVIKNPAGLEADPEARTVSCLPLKRLSLHLEQRGDRYILTG